MLDSAPIRYFLMGDTMDAAAAGNVWKEERSWPVPGRPRTFYFTAAGDLRDRASAEKDANVAGESRLGDESAYRV